MKKSDSFNEIEYVNTLFTKTSDEAAEMETDFPLVDTPENLSDELYAITESSKKTSNHRTISSWPKLASIAASILMAVVLLQVYQQHQTLKQLEQAQTDLATALHYLGEANNITRAQMLNTLNSNMQKAAIGPVIKIGRGVILPTVETIESATKIQNRTL